MKRMFAGWRMKYVQAATRVKGCLFCALVKKGDDRARYILERGRHAFLVLNAFPYNSGHCMVAVNRHVGTMSALTAAERADVWRLCARAERAVGSVYRPEGMNVGLNLGRSSGAGVVGHLHVHLVPRWEGDTNFMAVVGETKVLPEDLDATYARLHGALSRLTAAR
jgi:ATP adenylyltransferase